MKVENDYLNDAVSYVRDNRTWTDAEEAVAFDRIGAMRCGIQQASPKIAQGIADLMDEFGQADGLQEGWWLPACDVNDIFFALGEMYRALQPIAWVNGIFDECVARDKQAVGFIAGKPFRVVWEDGRQLIWYSIIPADDAVFDELTRRLKLREDYGCEPSEIHRNGYSLFQYFKFK